MTNSVEDIRDIKGLVAVPFNWWWLALVAGVLLLVTVIVWWWKRRQPKTEAKRAVSLPTPLEIALAALQRLREMNLPVEEFYTQLADIVRQFIEGRYGLHAPERTTEEFLVEAHLPERHMALLRTFLVEADLVKFARHRPGKDDMARAFAAAENFVRESAG